MGARRVEKVVITGGTGFLGEALTRQLLGREGSPALRAEAVVQLDLSPPAPALATADPRVAWLRGDVRDRASLVPAFRGADVVFHCAALVDWGRARRDALLEVNVAGTANVLAACRDAGVPVLVHTSTMDVVYEGRAIPRGDETLPYPERFETDYCESKALAEKQVLAWAASSERPALAVVRPVGMYGEGDPYHVTQSLLQAEKGALVARLGDGRAIFSHVYVGNVAHGMILAAERLLAGDAQARGRVYFVCDDEEPNNFFDFMAPIMEGLGHRFPPRWASIPAGPAKLVAGAVARVARARGTEPTVTPESINMICRDFAFTDARARRELGYAAAFSGEEARARTIAWFRAHGPVRR
ncbi:MAG: NAD-dependent epimerase/dehydratase family protein [Myxococcota bacterium]